MIGFYYYEKDIDLVTSYKRNDCGEYIVAELDYALNSEAQLCFDFVEGYLYDKRNKHCRFK